MTESPADRVIPIRRWSAVSDQTGPILVDAVLMIGFVGFHVFRWRTVNMNRVVVLGAATFFALVGIALFGGADKAVAGHGCGGCSGVAACSGDDCSASCRGGLLKRLRERCHGRCAGSCAGETTCCGEPAPEPTCCTPAPECGGHKHDCCGRVGLLKKMRDARCHGRTRCAGRKHCCGEVAVCPPTCCG